MFRKEDFLVGEAQDEDDESETKGSDREKDKDQDKDNKRSQKKRKGKEKESSGTPESGKSHKTKSQDLKPIPHVPSCGHPFHLPRGAQGAHDQTDTAPQSRLRYSVG